VELQLSCCHRFVEPGVITVKVSSRLFARGSLCELETQVIIACNLGYASEADPLLSDINELFAKLTALMTAINKKRI
jgi:hypothetical protein